MRRRRYSGSDELDERSGQILDLEEDRGYRPTLGQVVASRSGRTTRARSASYDEIHARRLAAEMQGRILDDVMDGRRVYPDPPRVVRPVDRLDRLAARLTPLILPFAILAWIRICMIAADWWLSDAWTFQRFVLAATHAIFAGGLCLLPAGILMWRRDAPRSARLVFAGAVLWGTVPAAADALWWFANRSPGTLDLFGYPVAALLVLASIGSAVGAVAMAYGFQRLLRYRNGWFDDIGGRVIASGVLCSLVAAARLIPGGAEGGTVSGQTTYISRAIELIPPPQALDVVRTYGGLEASTTLVGLLLVTLTALGACFTEPQARFWRGIAIGMGILTLMAMWNVQPELVGDGPMVGRFDDPTLLGLVAGVVLAAAVAALYLGLSSPIWSVEADADERQGPPDDVFVWGPTARLLGHDPIPMSAVVAVAAGADHCLAVDANGRVVAWGDDTYGQIDVPADLREVVGVAAGDGFSLALRADGTVAAWGTNAFGQATPPAELRDVRAIAAGRAFGLALRSDGTVVGWGDSTGVLPVPDGLAGVTAISAGQDHALALRSDGTIVAWGDDSSGQATVPPLARGAKAISAGGDFSLALRADGTVVAWGDDRYGQLDVPAGLSGVVAISAGSFHALALLVGGSVVGWGGGEIGSESSHPWKLIDFKAVAAGDGFSVGVRAA